MGKAEQNKIDAWELILKMNIFLVNFVLKSLEISVCSKGQHQCDASIVTHTDDSVAHAALFWSHKMSDAHAHTAAFIERSQYNGDGFLKMQATVGFIYLSDISCFELIFWGFEEVNLGVQVSTNSIKLLGRSTQVNSSLRRLSRGKMCPLLQMCWSYGFLKKQHVHVLIVLRFQCRFPAWCLDFRTAPGGSQKRRQCADSWGTGTVFAIGFEPHVMHLLKIRQFFFRISRGPFEMSEDQLFDQKGHPLKQRWLAFWSSIFRLDVLTKVFVGEEDPEQSGQNIGFPPVGCKISGYFCYKIIRKGTYRRWIEYGFWCEWCESPHPRMLARHHPDH